MKRIVFIPLFILFVLPAVAQIKTPAQLYPDLFDTVQMQQVYTDGKTFPDATPKRKPEIILQDYQSQKDVAGFNLKDFVRYNFTAPAESGTPYRSDIKAGIRQHIDTLWTVLQHVADTAKGTSLLPLPNRYIVPGGRFREIYYWDSYFTMLGLNEAKRYTTIENMVKNFAYLIDTYGHIPNGNRSYYLSRSQPPYFALMVELLASHQGNKALIKYRPQLIKEYQFWMQGSNTLKSNQAYAHAVRLPNGSLLNRYWDSSTQPREESYREDVLAAKTSQQKSADFYRNIRAAAESGWDFSSRWMADGKTLQTIQTTSFVPVDLNCLLYKLENIIARSYQASGNTKAATEYTGKAAKRKNAILKYCWSAQANAFVDYNWQQQKQATQPTIATAYPLFLNIATSQQATKVAAIIKNKFAMAGGVATTLSKTGQQWDRPNGWAPLQYVTIMGLRNYKQTALAQTIAQRWIKLNISEFNRSGKLLEKYDTENQNAKAGGGEYPLQDGFGWTNGVLLKLMNLYGMK
ncbi:alpha,alpha-trehalase TreF [Mucilaginibacter sp. Bleaf8]|uniref:alpha,alpha-trehalase TreF n=1 Tax=Mucilaginibacter sp. Bleaf8 TaxID=2834430 RepID=UPI001BD09788|nr:alpha,alpha-trehalase TreF [Mucilaginibacter sp. Bleaf8]MBS7566037.1 alpha,alpha-trehalase TreF [Mucilaginibacter sp. Bleaf8]